jgi:hypothetical protein
LDLEVEPERDVRAVQPAGDLSGAVRRPWHVENGGEVRCEGKVRRYRIVSRKETTLLQGVRKYIATIVVAGATAGVTAAITGGGPAMAFHTDHKAYYRRSAAVTIPPNTYDLAVANCPAGRKVIGGGGYTTGSLLQLEASYPSNGGNLTGFKAWTVYASNTDTQDQELTAYAICADVNRNSSYPGGVRPAA